MSCFKIVILFINIISLINCNNVWRDVSLSFIQHEIVPDVLEAPPAELLSVTFPNGEQALQGNELSPSQVIGVPTLQWNYQSDTYYTLIMLDADAPSRIAPEARSFLHWLVVNIPGDHVNKGDTLTNLLNSHPEPLTGLHRYIFLIYQQSGFVVFEEEPSDAFERRVNFLPDDFANKYEMGSPIAGNFYQTENFEDLIETFLK